MPSYQVKQNDQKIVSELDLFEFIQTLKSNQ